MLINLNKFKSQFFKLLLFLKKSLIFIIFIKNQLKFKIIHSKDKKILYKIYANLIL